MVTPAKDKRILIVGGGPVGLFAAIRLVGFGIPITLIDKSKKVSSDIRASTIHPPSLEMMAPYGITEEILETGIKVRQWQIRNHLTGDKVVFDLNNISDETDYPYRVQFEQSKICKIMDRQLRANPLADIRYGTEFVSLSQNDNGIIINVESGKGSETICGQFLIAADGGNSSIREHLGLAFEGSTYPEKTVLVTTPFPFHEYIDGLSSVSYCWEEKGNFSLLQLPDQWRASLYFPENMSQEEALDDKNIQKQLHDICPIEGPFEIYDKRVYRVHQRIVNKYDHGRIALAGDAAHVNSPSGGMGMNGGLHDAHNLTEKLNKIWLNESRDNYFELLDLYSRQRKPIAEQQIIKQADENRKRMTEKNHQRRQMSLDELQKISDDPIKCKAFLMKSSMYEGLRKASSIE
ncbi:MAG: NAD(P)/FAD-dependent oxidoreductase [Pseudomonadota bacterium]|nr:NAD(P)/FAD-dependent oxidoreductase [Pseudomonadota bacterium]